MELYNAQIIRPDAIERGSLTVRSGRIQRLSKGRRPRGGGPHSMDLRGGFLAPGLIDLHVHGALGCDTMEATEEAFRTITTFHLTGGTTSMALTTVTASHPQILGVLKAVRPCLNRSLGGARILGVHVEGPYISPEKAGAQKVSEIRPPQPVEWRELLRHSKVITQMTVAPEVTGALPLIRALRRKGIIASAGHTNADDEAMMAGLRAGLTQTTHTFNCMSTATKRGPVRVAGAVEFALAHPALCCELIADGVHVSPTLMRMLINAKGCDGVCLITDAVSGAGLPLGTRFGTDPESGAVYVVGEQAGITGDGKSLAGSLLTMLEGVQRVVDLAGVSLVEAVRMGSLVPARQLGREDELGSIDPGKRADLIWFDRQYRVRGAWLDGELRFLA